MSEAGILETILGAMERQADTIRLLNQTVALLSARLNLIEARGCQHEFPTGSSVCARCGYVMAVLCATTDSQERDA